jgi:type II secretory pathway component GspD/PulD (secretin)
MNGDEYQPLVTVAQPTLFKFLKPSFIRTCALNPLCFITKRHHQSPAPRPSMLKRWVAMGVLALMVGFGLPTLYPQAGWTGQPTAGPQVQQLQGTAPITADIQVPGGNSKRVSIQVTDRSIREVLRDLSTQGHFNLAMDDSVQGNITLELNNVTVNDALSSISGIAGVEILKKGSDIYLAMSKKLAEERGLTRQLSKIVKIRYANSQRVAQVLSASVFSAHQSQNAAMQSSNNVQPVQNDARTNSIILVGTEREIQLAEAVIGRLDQPRQRRTFYLSHANALDIATLLSSSVYNDGTLSGIILSQSGSGSGGGASGNSMGGIGGGMGGMGGGGMGGMGSGNMPGVNLAMGTPSSLRVEQEDIEEGEGVNAFSGSSSGSGDSSSGGSSSSFGSSVKLRGTVKKSLTVNVSPEGPLVVPDTRTNSVTILGTAEHIALAERFIPIFDARLPQVAIEVSLVEITDTGSRDLGATFGINDHERSFGFNNQQLFGVQPASGISGQTAGYGITGIPTTSSGASAAARSAFGYSSRPIDNVEKFSMQLKALIKSNRAKTLANPTIVATHDSESIISIVDEIVRRVTVETQGITGFTTNTVELGEAGIVLNILPKIGSDGTITMRIRPSVTTVRDTQTDSRDNTITLLSKRDFLAQRVRVNDGQTLVIGGLIKQNDTNQVEKLPGVSELPIVGALFRATTRTTGRSELVLLLTPHILNNTQLTPVTAVSGAVVLPNGTTNTNGGEP